MSIFNKEKSSAEVVVEEICKIKKNEKVLIIANPETNLIAQDLFTACTQSGAKTTLIYQQKKSSMENAEESVIGALKSEPDVCFSISAVKLGKDAQGQMNPYKTSDGKQYDSIFDYLLEGKKTMRAVWTPGITVEMFERTVKIDYKLLGERCKKICAKYKNAETIHVTAPSGTDVTVNISGRNGLCDDGNFSEKGSGGNIPAGEVFVSPVVGKTQGKIVFDGSMTFSDGDSILNTPISVKVENGFVTEITGGEEAKRLLKDITAAEKEALSMESKGKLPKGQGEVYAKNARNIGELGIGLNPNANITGNMLEDEKAFRTCHFAIGQNYDGDANALIHFDGIVRNPTVVIKYSDGTEFTLLSEGELKI
ncbi:MAG: aminopeptidase [Treponema sp.]|nr:aminopeptidase [Spirochaetia bacterium]MDY4902924.1 aminopeptidase [Treponema sp.]